MRLAALVFAVVVTGAASPVLTPQDLAGNYYSGDGLGANLSLRIRVDGTYDFAWNGCLGLYDQRRGRIRLEANTLTLGARSSASESFQLPDRLRPVRWGKRLYLVADEDGAEFAASINRGSEPRKAAHGLALLRRDDWKKLAAGQPDLPEEWRKWILAAPVHATVVSVENSGKRAVIDVGRSQGVEPGLILTISSKETYALVKVVSVDAGSSVVETTFADDRLTVGLPVTSRE